MFNYTVKKTLKITTFSLHIKIFLFFDQRYEQSELNTMFHELIVCISQNKLLQAIKQLKANKLCGQDMYIKWFIHV